MISTIMLMHNITPELQEMTKAAIDTIKSDELIIIDNNSLYGGGYARSVADIYVRNNTNVGYPRAVNQGFHLSKGEFIAVANNDIRVSPNWREVSLEIFEDKTVGSVHIRMINYDDPMILGNRTWLTGRERWCHASFFVIRREAFPIYDEVYKEGGYDDYDMMYRMRHLNGWKTAYTTKACFQHAHSKTYQAMDSNGSREKRDENNRHIFISKFGEDPDTLFRKTYPEQWKEDYYSFFRET